MKDIKRLSVSRLRTARASVLIISAFAATGVLFSAGAVSISVEKGPITTEGGAAEAAEFVAGEIIVVFGGNLAPAAIEASVEAVGGKITKISTEDPSRVVVSVPEGEEDEYIDAYLQSGLVVAAEKNYVLSTQPEPKRSKHKTSISE